MTETSNSYFKIGTVWCYARCYIFLVLEDNKMLCLDGGNAHSDEVGRTFTVLSLNCQKNCVQLA